MCKTGSHELIAMYLRQLFILIERAKETPRTFISSYIQEEMEIARRYFTSIIMNVFPLKSMLLHEI